MTYTPSKFPPAAVDSLSASGAGSLRNGSLETVATVTLDRTGQWLVICRNDMWDTSSGMDNWGKVRTVVNGVEVASAEKSGTGGSDNWVGTEKGVLCWWQGSASSGQSASVQIANGDGSSWNRNATGHIDAYFIPIAANPQ